MKKQVSILFTARMNYVVDTDDDQEAEQTAVERFSKDMVRLMFAGNQINGYIQKDSAELREADVSNLSWA